MSTRVLREHLEARPFIPFEIITADGREFAVSHPDGGVLSPGGRTITLVAFDESVITIDVLLITSLRLLPIDRSFSA
ncbi:MAG: hypothetical protein AAGJ97_03400 [Planctomycetota bacterium]